MSLSEKQKALIIKTDDETSDKVAALPFDEQDLVCQGKHLDFGWFSEELENGEKGSTWLLPTQFIETHDALLKGGLHKEPWTRLPPAFSRKL
jgi:hypothetical protein